MKKYILIFILSFISAYTQAQDSTKTNKTYKNHIGISTQFLQNFISKDNNSPIQLIYKRQLSKTSAFRLIVEGFYSKIDSSAFWIQQLPDKEYKLYAGLALGYEKQYYLAPKWKLHVGVDVKYGINFRKEYGGDWVKIDNTGTTNFYMENDYDTRNLHFMPFIGARYHINPKVYLVVESRLNVQQSEMNSEVVVYNDRSAPKYYYGYEKNNSINLNYTVIQLFFTF